MTTYEEIIEVRFKRYRWLPRLMNDFREGLAVKACFKSRLPAGYTHLYYRILQGRSLAGERPRSLFVTLNDGREMVYKLTSCKKEKHQEFLTFERMNK